jgi:Fe-S-cluster containining protein
MKYKTFVINAIIIEHEQPESNVPCTTIKCTECCEKLSPYLTEEELRSGKYLYTLLNSGDPNRPVIAIPKTDRGCFYFTKEKTCSIYENRPQACRQFDCRKSHHPNIKNKFTESEIDDET